MAHFQFSDHFAAFFRRLNPSPSFEAQAAREYSSIKSLIENRQGLAAALSPRCFLQGSYKQSTAIYAINDVDIVTLCELWQPGSGAGGGQSYDRHTIFDIIAAPLLADHRYRTKVHYAPTSMCIKVNLGIKIEILPVVYKAGTYDPQTEPFRLYRPERGQWEDGYARYHQMYLTLKNQDGRTAGNFIPAIKVMKHVRSLYNLDAVSFHVECLLHWLPDSLFLGSPADYLPRILLHLASTPADIWYSKMCPTPCGERDIFTSAEWSIEPWRAFHAIISKAAPVAAAARDSENWLQALDLWQAVFGESFFPATTT
jgi:hypothetical protein